MPGRPNRNGCETKLDSAGAARPDGIPWRITTSRPCSTPSMPSVITSGGMRSSVTPRPLSRPNNAPVTTQARMAIGMPASTPFIRLPAMIAESETTPPTERSMPSRPPRMTRFWPAATMPRRAATISRRRICCGDAKPGESISPRKSNATIRISATASGCLTISRMRIELGAADCDETVMSASSARPGCRSSARPEWQDPGRGSATLMACRRRIPANL